MKKKRIALIIICIILLIVVSVIWWQFDNIKSVYFYFKYSAEDIDILIQNSNKEVEDYLEKNTEIKVRPTEEIEEKLHQAGVITDEELAMIIMGQTSLENLFGTEISTNEKKQFVESQTGDVLTVETLKKMKEETALNQTVDSENAENDVSSETGDKNSEAVPGSEKSPDNEKKADETKNTDNNESATGNENTSLNPEAAQISQYVAQMYVLKSSFSGQLGALYNEAVSSFYSLPKSQRNEAGKSSIIKDLYPKAAALEASCDKQVATLLKELEALLVGQGESTELVTKMRTAYYQEKSLAKARYMNEL